MFTSKHIVSIILLILLSALTLPAWADNGGGSGGGKDEPLSLLSSSPANGAEGVPTSVSFTLGFSKNVINMRVAEANRSCFALLDPSGSKIPLQVIMADDQIEPEKKRIITVKPLEALREGTDYTLVIYASLEAKSGATLGRDVKIRFSTAGKAATPVVASYDPEVPDQATNDTPAADPPTSVGSENAALGTEANASGISQAAVTTPASADAADDPEETAADNETAEDDTSSSASVWIVLAITLAATAALIYYRKKR